MSFQVERGTPRLLTRRFLANCLAGAITGTWSGSLSASDTDLMKNSNGSSVSLRLLKTIPFRSERPAGGAITSLAWNPNGTLLAVAFDWGRKVAVLDTGSWTVVGTFSRTATLNKSSMGFCSDDELVTLPNDERLDSVWALSVYDARKGKVVDQISRPTVMKGIAQSMIVTGDRCFAALNTFVDRQLIALYFDLKKAEFVDAVPTLPGASALLIAAGPSAQMALSAIERGSGPLRLKPIALVDLRARKIERMLPGQAPGIASMAWSPNGQWLASGGSSEQPHDPHPIRIWDVVNGREKLAISGAYSPVSSVAWHPTLPIFVTKGAKGTGALGSAVRLWSAVDGRLIFEYLTSGQAIVSEVSFHPLTGQLVWTADNALHLFDILQ